ncbi:MAG: hypothetical protein RJA81_1306 [Planctomycetota bacterium]|jgi:RNA polymerase sigma-70 factor (ECF subfamily)
MAGSEELPDILIMNNDDSKFELSEAAFLKLLVKHEPSLRAYARSLVPDWNHVDEALQEASVTMWQKRGQLTSSDGFVPWAKVILRFKCLRQVEKLRSERLLLCDEIILNLADRGENRSEAETAARGLALHECLQQFSSEHRELLLAPHSSTTSVVELAVLRKKTPNALYKLLGRLREKLAGCIRLKLTTEVQ